jgi:hypothetical protein
MMHGLCPATLLMAGVGWEVFTCRRVEAVGAGALCARQRSQEEAINLEHIAHVSAGAIGPDGAINHHI